jgi:hypothetical protein
MWLGTICERRTEMYAVLRLNSFDPAKLAASREQLEEFDRVHAAQPGYVGSVVVDLVRQPYLLTSS